MGSYIATWEDEEHNRLVQFSVDYSAENGSVEIENVTPKKVSFVCPESNSLTRSIRVHTNAGRDLLTSQIQKSGSLERLANEIAARTQQPVNV